jgi:hypothetical protein
VLVEGEVEEVGVAAALVSPAGVVEEVVVEEAGVEMVEVSVLQPANIPTNHRLSHLWWRRRGLLLRNDSHHLGWLRRLPRYRRR